MTSEVERPVTPARTVTVHIPETTSLSGKPVAQSTIDGIIELRLRGMTAGAVATELGLDWKTVEDHWKKYLRARSEARLSDTEVAFAELIERLNQNALDSRAGYYRSVASDSAHAESHGVKYLAAERQALDSLARLGVERDDAPALQARMAAANATVFASVVREVISRVPLSSEQKASVIAEFALALRSLDAPQPVVIEVVEP